MTTALMWAAGVLVVLFAVYIVAIAVCMSKKAQLDVVKAKAEALDLGKNIVQGSLIGLAGLLVTLANSTMAVTSQFLLLAMVGLVFQFGVILMLWGLSKSARS